MARHPGASAARGGARARARDGIPEVRIRPREAGRPRRSDVTAEMLPATLPSALLSSREVASFVANGFLRFDDIVPRDACAAALDELARGAAALSGAPAGSRLDDIWRESPAIGPILRLPRLAGVIHSLVGPGARYDHHHAHVVPALQRWSQPWHADAILDPRPLAFDIQLFFFFH